MGVLLFDGVDDKLQWTTLGTNLSNTSDGAWTCAGLVKVVTSLDGGVSYLHSGTAPTGSSRIGLGMSADDHVNVDPSSGPYCVTSGTFTDTTNPYIWVASKTSGTVAPRLGWKLGSGGAWTHVDLIGGLQANQAAATFLQIGANIGTFFFNGHIGVVAYWEGAMSDTNKETLDNNWRTSDWYTNAHGTPTFLAELNVAAGSVVDLIGNATSLTTTGTTLDSGETLNSWNFNGTGIVATTYTGWYGSSGGWF